MGSRHEPKSVLVTGGAGFIGSHLVDLLRAKNVGVRVLDDCSTGQRANIAHHLGKPGFEFFPGSVLDSVDMEQAMRGVDTVFHLATLGVRHSIKHPLTNHRVNSEGALLTLEAARRNGVKKFVHCSSSEVYGTAQTVPMTEAHPTHPHTIYGAGKLAGEAYALAYHRTYGLPVTVIRPFNTFGPRSHFEGDAGEFIPKAIVRLLGRKPVLVFGDGAQTRDFTYVVDTAEGLYAAAISAGTVGKTFNIGSRFEISIAALAEKLAEQASLPKKDFIQFTESRPGDVLRLYAEVSAFEKLTEWRPRLGFAEGLARTFAWFQDYLAKHPEQAALETGLNWK